MTRGSLIIFLALNGCGGRLEPEYGGAAAAVSYAAECEGEPTPPTKLQCTGLYANMAKKALAEGVMPYSPARHLWSDGAEKNRFILLPKGKKIDASDPNEWSFPLGTKVWKEFVVDGKRVETRLFVKTSSRWDWTTYAWNGKETQAEASRGADITGPDGNPYHIPTHAECDQCHRGRTDRVLGFEQVSLGLDGATGMTLEDLVSKHLLSPVPDRTSYEIGDDGTGLAKEPLAWLHVNCGVTCHNDNAGAQAYGAKMRLRLDPAMLDGRPSNSFPSIVTTVGATVNTPTWHDQIRIVPGDPNSSLLVQLITTRTNGAGTETQMPPIASRLVDTMDADTVIAWIAAMKKTGTQAGSPSSGGSTATTDGGAGNGVR